MSGEKNLNALLRDLTPRLHPGEYVFTQVRGETPAGAEPVVTVRESEGTTLVLPRAQADTLGLTYGYVAARLTLEVHSSLEAVGLTATVSRVLADAGISANVVAGYSHDHIFIPRDRAGEAARLLEALSVEAGGPALGGQCPSP